MKRLNTYINEKLVINKKYTNPNNTAFIDDDMYNAYHMGKKSYSTFTFPKVNDSDDTTKLDDKTISRIIYQLSNATPSQDMVDTVKNMFYDVDLSEDAVIMKYDWKSGNWNPSEASFTKKFENAIRFVLNNDKTVNSCYFTIMKNIHIIFFKTTDYFVGVSYYAKTAETLKHKNKMHRICAAIIFEKK